MVDDEVESARQRVSRAIRNWMIKLEDYPGWREWRKSRIGYTLHFDDEFMPPKQISEEFHFDPQVDAEHGVVTLYLSLLDTVSSLRDVEWYFRRYPFSGTPVSRYNHLMHCCELYFGRFYQFKEHLKNLFDAVKKAVPDHRLEIGRFIKQFDRNFTDEIRARHGVHHRERFEDIVISRVFLMESFAMSKPNGGWREEYLSHYRKAANVWAARVRRRADHLDLFIEAVAEALLKVCPFLDDAEP